MDKHDASRTANAGASPVPVDLDAYALDWEVATPFAMEAYYPGVADLLPTPGFEVVVGLSEGLAVYDAGGGLRGFWGLPYGGSGQLSIADLDDDGENEIFVSQENSLDAYEADGDLLWTHSWKRRTSSTISTPIAIDIDGDGGLDIVQTSRYYELEIGVGGISATTPLPDEAPAVIGIDGETGRVLFEHLLPCGEVGTSTLGFDQEERPMVVVGCLARKDAFDGVPGSSVRALRLDETNAVCGALPPTCSVLDLTEVLWTTEIQDGEATIWQIVGGDFDRAPGPEIVALWVRDGHLGLTTLSLGGEILVEIVDEAFFRASAGPSVGDLNRDGLDDLVLAIPEVGMVAYHATSAGFARAWVFPDEPDLGHSGQSLSDLDGDGGLEIVSNWQGEAGATLSGAVRIHDADGNLLWEARLHTPPGDMPVMPIRNPCIGDIDGDGTHEICVAARGKFLVFKAPPA